MSETVTDAIAHTTAWSVLTVPWDDERAVALRAAMDDELGPRYADKLDGVAPEQAERIARALAIDPSTITATIIAMDAGGTPIAHAALRDLGAVLHGHRGGELSGALEVKRVYVAPSVRGSGVSKLLMSELERIAAARGSSRLILQTGDRQPDAVALYEKIGYTRIQIYPPYLDLDFSNCYEKHLG